MPIRAIVRTLAALTLALSLGSCDPWREPLDLGGTELSAADLAAARNFQLAAMPQQDMQGAPEKSLWATYYYVHQADEQPGLPLLNKDNQAFTATISAKDYCLGGIEGTLLITSKAGKQATYNYADAKGPQQADCADVLGWSQARAQANPWIKATGKIRYQFAGNRYGTGVANYQLVPFRSIAVDDATIPYGTALYIPAADGLRFQHDGQQYSHDGYFFAADTGGAIKQDHIDIFQGLETKNAWPKLIGSAPSLRFTAYKVNNPAIALALRKLHQKAE